LKAVAKKKTIVHTEVLGVVDKHLKIRKVDLAKKKKTSDANA